MTDLKQKIIQMTKGRQGRKRVIKLTTFKHLEPDLNNSKFNKIYRK